PNWLLEMAFKCFQTAKQIFEKLIQLQKIKQPPEYYHADVMKDLESLLRISITNSIYVASIKAKLKSEKEFKISQKTISVFSVVNGRYPTIYEILP
ncbi:hypothetical protein HK096_001562, partial [Nowakowskiella sp. JEL0078]